MTSTTAPAGPRRTARCACGGLQLHLTGEPLSVYTCSCQACQRTTGSVFGYRALFRTGNIVAVEGEQKRWRRRGDAGRWVEHVFCPACGTLVFMEAEGLSDSIAVSVGCFADPDFAAPKAWYWRAKGHGWVTPPPDARVMS